MLISGWFETEEGATFVDVEDVEDVAELAYKLYVTYGGACIGVDIDLDGEFNDGTDVIPTMTELQELLVTLYG